MFPQTTTALEHRLGRIRVRYLNGTTGFSAQPPAGIKPVAVMHISRRHGNPVFGHGAHTVNIGMLVLQAGGCKSEDLCRSFMGKLVKDYTEATVREAVTAAIKPTNLPTV